MPETRGSADAKKLDWHSSDVGRSQAPHSLEKTEGGGQSTAGSRCAPRKHGALKIQHESITFIDEAFSGTHIRMGCKTKCKIL
eukprot:12950966-Alexandrium_andersonii.AAC.1